MSYPSSIPQRPMQTQQQYQPQQQQPVAPQYPSGIGSLLSGSDYAELSNVSGVHREILASRLQASRSFSEFKVLELKEIIKFLRGRSGWSSNPAFAQRQPTHASAGKKQQLIDHLKLIIQTQHQLNALSAASHNTSIASGSNDAMQLQQQQYRQQQQHAQQAASAARFQANPSAAASSDPYRYAQQQQRPASMVQQPQAMSYSSYQQATNQQFSYSNGTREHYSPYNTPAARNVYQQPLQQQHPQNGYYQPNGYAQQPAAAASHLPPHMSHQQIQQQQLQTRQQEINALQSHPNMLRHLSPYEQVIQALARNLLNAHSHTAHQSTGAAGGAHHTTLSFNISAAHLPKIKRSTRPVPPGQESQQLEVHLRLFSAITMDHQQWDKKFRVHVNQQEVVIPEPKKLSRTKQKGLELVRGLDISEYVQASNTIEISVYRQSYTVDLFRGLVSADLVRIRDTSELMEQMKKVVKDEESKMQATALMRSCVICQSKKDPLRCSRCKSEWYCGSDHQRQHWPTHREKCVQPTPEQDRERERIEKEAAQKAMLGPNGRTRLTMPVKMKPEPTAAGGDDDEIDGVEEVDALVSLKCPLSLERYELPARGRNCGHLPCFNLETYLMFSQMSGVWQCPVCHKGVAFEEIEVNLQMAAILRETDPEISQIRVNNDGQYDPIRPIPDGETGDGREPRKRKQPSASPTNAPTQPPTKSAAIGQGTAPANTAGASSPIAASTAVVASSATALVASTAVAPIAADPSNGDAAPDLTTPAGAAPSSTTAASSAPSPAPTTTTTPAPPDNAGTVDEPIELD